MPAPRQFRLSDAENALIDALQVSLGVGSRTDVVRVALRYLADREFGKGNAGPAKEPEKKARSRRKSAD